MGHPLCFEERFMRKILYITVTLLETALLAGTCVIRYFADRKLGMVRWVNYYGMKWEKTYPVMQIRSIAVLLLAVLSVLAFCLYMKRRDFLTKFTGVMTAAMCVISSLSIGYMMFCSFEKMRVYYLLGIMFLAAAVIQLIKTFAGILMCPFRK